MGLHILIESTYSPIRLLPLTVYSGVFNVFSFGGDLTNCYSGLAYSDFDIVSGVEDFQNC
jgi:hypothetical protein